MGDVFIVGTNTPAVAATEGSMLLYNLIDDCQQTVPANRSAGADHAQLGFPYQLQLGRDGKILRISARRHRNIGHNDPWPQTVA